MWQRQDLEWAAWLGQRLRGVALCCCWVQAPLGVAPWAGLQCSCTRPLVEVLWYGKTFEGVGNGKTIKMRNYGPRKAWETLYGMVQFATKGSLGLQTDRRPTMPLGVMIPRDCWMGHVARAGVWTSVWGA